MLDNMISTIVSLILDLNRMTIAKHSLVFGSVEVRLGLRRERRDKLAKWLVIKNPYFGSFGTWKTTKNCKDLQK